MYRNADIIHYLDSFDTEVAVLILWREFVVSIMGSGTGVLAEGPFFGGDVAAHHVDDAKVAPFLQICGVRGGNDCHAEFVLHKNVIEKAGIFFVIFGTFQEYEE